MEHYYSQKDITAALQAAADRKAALGKAALAAVASATSSTPDPVPGPAEQYIPIGSSEPQAIPASQIGSGQNVLSPFRGPSSLLPGKEEKDILTGAKTDPTGTIVTPQKYNPYHLYQSRIPESRGKVVVSCISGGDFYENDPRQYEDFGPEQEMSKETSLEHKDSDPE